MYSKFFAFKTKVLTQISMLRSDAVASRKIKFAAVAVALLAVVTPLSVAAITNITQVNGSLAEENPDMREIPAATSAMPADFTDQNFYNCVEAAFKAEFPGETIAQTGLTDAQLARITILPCVQQNVRNAAGLEKLTALTKLYIYDNQVSALDLRHNGDLEILKADDVMLKTEISSMKTATTRNFMLNDLKFIGDHEDIYNNIIPNTATYTFDEATKMLSVQMSAPDQYAQIVANTSEHATYKLQLPQVYTISYNLNGGRGNIFDQTHELFETPYAVKISNTIPTKSDYVFLGWSTNSAATSAEYQPGDTIKLSVSSTVLYAVWHSNATPQEPANGFVLKYDSNGGTDAPAAQSCSSKTAECEFNLTTQIPFRSGYSFTGWSKDPASPTGFYHPGETFKTADRETVLYAIWQKTSAPVSTGAVTWKHGRDHTKGSNDDAIVNIDYPATSFKELKLNDKTLERDKDYTIESTANNTINSNEGLASTTITIKSAPLDALNPNPYNIVASFNEADIHTTINILAKDNFSTYIPPLGVTNSKSNTDNNTGMNPGVIIGIVLVCVLVPILAGVLAFVIARLVKPKRKMPIGYYTYDTSKSVLQ